MAYLNVCIGELGTNRKRFTIAEDGEEFYMTSLYCLGMELPIVASSYYIDKYKGEKVKCSIVPNTKKKKVQGKRRVFTYLWCVFMEPTDEDESRAVEIKGKVVDVDELVLSDDCTTRVKFKLECRVKLDNLPVARFPCVAYEHQARKLLTIKPGDLVSIRGYISGYGTHIRVVAQHAEKEVRK